MSLPKLPLRIGVDDLLDSYWRIWSADGQEMDGGRRKSWPDGWPIPDARQAAERRLTELTRMIEDATPKCPIRKSNDPGDDPEYGVHDGRGRVLWFYTEAERDAVYDALVALWHKENGT